MRKQRKALTIFIKKDKFKIEIFRTDAKKKT